MADAHASGDPQRGLFRTYMAVAAALAVCTASSFAFNGMVHAESLSVAAGFGLILAVAVVKAALVVFYFMHLKWDWRALYFLLVPALVLALMTVIILIPDSVVGPGRDAAEALQINQDVADESR